MATSSYSPRLLVLHDEGSRSTIYWIDRSKVFRYDDFIEEKGHSGSNQRKKEVTMVKHGQRSDDRESDIASCGSGYMGGILGSVFCGILEKRGLLGTNRWRKWVRIQNTELPYEERRTVARIARALALKPFPVV